MIRIAVIDDHPMILEGLINVFERSEDIIVCGTYGTGNALLSEIAGINADLLLLDLQLPDIGGVELVPRLLEHFPDLKIIILSSLETTKNVQHMMQLGCKGYLLKSDCSKDMLLEAVHKIYDGNTYINPSLQNRLLRDFIKPVKLQDLPVERITRREKEVLLLVAEEYSNHQIAEKLFVSVRTAEAHRYSLQRKLKAKNTVALIRIAKEMGLLKV